MLQELHIENVLLIEKTSVYFQNGFSVITGQTGAGKSIILECLSIVLGERSTPNLIREGKNQATIIAVFDLKKIINKDFLEKINIDTNSDLIIKKIITKTNSKIYVNDLPVTITLINLIKSEIIEIHSQFEQIISSNKNDINFLDSFLKIENKLELKKLYEEFKISQKEYQQKAEESIKLNSDFEYFSDIVSDAKDLNLDRNEYECLIQKRKEIVDNEKIISYFSNVEKYFDQYQSSNLLNKIEIEIAKFIDKINNHNIKQELENIESSLDKININLIDVIENFKKITNNLISKESDLEKIEHRISAIRDISRKYKIQPELLFNFFNESEIKLKSIEDIEEEILKLKKIMLEKQKEYYKIAEEISKKRQENKFLFENQVMIQLSDIGMEKAKFNIYLERIEPTELGIDKVSYQASINPGAPLLPISKIASGGELSRFMLAFKIIIASSSNIKTIIFDEIDTGVSGKVAYKIGEKMKELSKHIQVIAISHNPQVISRAEHHFLVKKSHINEDSSTISEIKELNFKERILYIAEMLSHNNITEEAIRNAKNLLD